jgi:hypothetical protein
MSKCAAQVPHCPASRSLRYIVAYHALHCGARQPLAPPMSTRQQHPGHHDTNFGDTAVLSPRCLSQTASAAIVNTADNGGLA